MTQIHPPRQWYAMEELNAPLNPSVPTYMPPTNVHEAYAALDMPFEDEIAFLLQHNNQHNHSSSSSESENSSPTYAPTYYEPFCEPDHHAHHHGHQYPHGWVPAAMEFHNPALGYTFDAEGNCYNMTPVMPQEHADTYLSYLQEVLLSSKKRKFFDDVMFSSNRPRPVRPKVIEGKGSVQCEGKNRKKGTQCRNAALMEYIGPRPQYCAEHIELDPNSLYEKCKSRYAKETGDNKGCKEVVLKEFGFCYKHFHDVANDITRQNQLDKATHMLERVTALHLQLEEEASAAKKKDGDLFQRKNKLIPKFGEMKRMMNKAIQLIKERETEGRTPPLQSPSAV